MGTRGRWLMGVAWLSAAACAHAPPAPPPPPVAWPAPPAAPVVRLLGILPLAGAQPARSGAGHLLDLLTGEEHAPAPGDAPARPAGLATADGRTWAVADPAAPGLFLLAEGAAPVKLDCAAAPWVGPMAVAFAPDGALLVADAAAGRVVRHRAGRCEVLLSGLERPTGVTLAGGRVYVVDGPRHEVVSVDLAGGPLLRFGAEALESPSAIAASPEGHLLVADALAARVVRFSPGGRVLGTLGGRDPEAGGLLRPRGVAADAAGRVLVLDGAEDRLALFGADGRLIALLGEHGDGPGRFSQATGLALSGARLGIAEAAGRIQIFELLGGTP